jgi:hypothetical protein
VKPLVDDDRLGGRRAPLRARPRCSGRIAGRGLVTELDELKARLGAVGSEGALMEVLEAEAARLKGVGGNSNRAFGVRVTVRLRGRD